MRINTNVGPQGATGAGGAGGTTGATGVVGVSGATGVVGVSGATGVVGVSGATGVAGVTGVTGATGASTGTVILGMLPGLRLTLTTATPITTADVTGAGTLYYTPYLNGNIATYDSSVWTMHTFTEQSLALTLTSGKNYDVFIVGAGTLSLSSAWTNDTTRADALGTQDGIQVLGSDHSKRWIGTIRASGTNVCADALATRYVWNAYNQVPRPMKAVETTNTWTYANPNSVWRQANAAAANRLQYVTGDIGTRVNARVDASGQPGGTGYAAVGIGVDSTTVASAQTASVVSAVGSAGPFPIAGAAYNGFPGLGYHAINWLETSNEAATTTTFYGDNGGALFTSGILGEVRA